MPWSWGGFAGGASKGVAALADLLQRDEENKRQDAILADTRAQRDQTAKRQAILDRLSAVKDLPAFQDAGAYVDQPTTAPVSRTPGLAPLPSIGNVSRGTSENADLTSTTRRPLALADLLRGDANIGIDPAQSKAAVALRGKQAALQAYSKHPTPETRAAFLGAGGTPGEADEIQAKPTAQVPEWQAKGYPSEAAYLEYVKKDAEAKRGPSDHFTFLPDETGKLLRGNTATGAIDPTGVQGKPPVTRIESALNTAAKARLEAAVSEMNNANTSMAQFEGELANGTRKISAPQQVLQRVANAFTHDDPLSQLTQSGTLALLNSTDPELARYIRRGLSFAEGESMISQRPSDFRTKMSAFLSTAASGATPEMIHDIQSRRSAILNPLNATVTPTTPGTSPAATHAPAPSQAPSQAPTQAQALWDAAVKKYGEAKVLSEYGPRPPH